MIYSTRYAFARHNSLQVNPKSIIRKPDEKLIMFVSYER
jgi:hypothetical protein